MVDLSYAELLSTHTANRQDTHLHGPTPPAVLAADEPYRLTEGCHGEAGHIMSPTDVDDGVDDSEKRLTMAFE